MRHRRWRVHYTAMCGRYVQARSGEKLAAMLDAQLAAGVEVDPSWNINPEQHVPVLFEMPDQNGALHREIYTVRWGLLTPWNKDEADCYTWRTHNANQETAHALDVAAAWEVYPVSRELGNAQNDRPGLLDPAAPETLF